MPKESSLESAISHTVILMTLPFLMRKDFNRLFLISTSKNSSSIASYLDWLLTEDENNITTKLFDNRDTCWFHIVNFAFMSNNILSAPAYGDIALAMPIFVHIIVTFCPDMGLYSQGFCHRVAKLNICPTQLRNPMTDTFTKSDNIRKMPFKFLLILSV